MHRSFHKRRIGIYLRQTPRFSKTFQFAGGNGKSAHATSSSQRAGGNMLIGILRCLSIRDQTISQPHIVAFMIQALQPASGDKVLEMGTGSGYQAAVLADWSQRCIPSRSFRNWRTRQARG